MTAINRPCSAANLDPANDNIPYDAAFDVRELVSVEEVMVSDNIRLRKAYHDWIFLFQRLISVIIKVYFVHVPLLL